MWCFVNTLNVVYGSIFHGGVTMKSYIERIRELREDNDLTQYDVSIYLKTTQQVYSRYEKGINLIPIHHIIALSRFYNVSCDYILGETDNPKRYN